MIEEMLYMIFYSFLSYGQRSDPARNSKKRIEGNQRLLCHVPQFLSSVFSKTLELCWKLTPTRKSAVSYTFCAYVHVTSCRSFYTRPKLV